MPLFRVCGYPGCGKRIPFAQHYCENHKKIVDARRAEIARASHSITENSSARGYNGKWRRAAREFLRANPLCVECKKHGIVSASTDVDHIIPWNNRGQSDLKLFWDRKNWQPLCHKCHSRKTARERAALRAEQRNS